MQLLIQYKNDIPIFRCLSKLPKKLWVIWTHFSMAKMFEMFSFWFPNVCVLKLDKNVESFASYCRVLMRSQTVWRWALLSCCAISVGEGVNIDTRELNYTPISFICKYKTTPYNEKNEHYFLIVITGWPLSAECNPSCYGRPQHALVQPNSSVWFLSSGIKRLTRSMGLINISMYNTILSYLK
jgi:hypothetical protein